MITVLLIAGLAVVAVYGIRLIAERSRFAGFGLLAVSLIGIPLVVFPDSSTQIANALGVGRGADLLVYVLFILVLLSLIVLHAAKRRSSEQLTLVVRALALATVRFPDQQTETNP